MRTKKSRTYRGFESLESKRMMTGNQGVDLIANVDAAGNRPVTTQEISSIEFLQIRGSGSEGIRGNGSEYTQTSERGRPMPLISVVNKVPSNSLQDIIAILGARSANASGVDGAMAEM